MQLTNEDPAATPGVLSSYLLCCEEHKKTELYRTCCNCCSNEALTAGSRLAGALAHDASASLAVAGVSRIIVEPSVHFNMIDSMIACRGLQVGL